VNFPANIVILIRKNRKWHLGQVHKSIPADPDFPSSFSKLISAVSTFDLGSPRKAVVMRWIIDFADPRDGFRHRITGTGESRPGEMMTYVFESTFLPSITCEVPEWFLGGGDDIPEMIQFQFAPVTLASIDLATAKVFPK
jgi:hypothetical protein